MTIEKVNCGDSTDKLLSSVNSLSEISNRPLHYQSLTNTLNTDDNSITLRTFLAVILIPVEFSSVRIGWPHLGGAGALTGMSALVASTDNIGDLTYTNTTACKQFITPQKDGVVHNDISIDGWQRVTWNETLTEDGAASLNMPDDGAGKIGIAWSDVVDVESLPLANGSHVGYNALMVRVFGGTDIVTRSSMVGLTDPSKFIADCGSRIVLATRRDGDKVTDPTNWTAADFLIVSDSTVTGLMIEAYTSTANSDKISVLFTGDSRFASVPSSETANAYRTSQWKTERQLKALGKRANYISAAQGGRDLETYFKTGTRILKDNQPTHSVYLAYSINDGLPTEPRASNARAKLFRYVAICREQGTEPVIVTSFPHGTGYTVDEYALLETIETLAASLDVKVLSALKIYGDASGGWTGFNSDDDHMTPAGYDDLANRLANLIVE